MSAKRSHDLQAAFQGALELPAAKRRAFLEDMCGADEALLEEVQSLLQALDDGAEFLEETGPRERAVGFGSGARLGPYELLEVIGEGGFGTVWSAQQQEPIQRQVALKIIKPGMDSREVLARFELERRALARMDHPNIARVLEAGATDGGYPFFVMELVRGAPITDYCDAQRLGTSARVTLLRQVCLAVQHAHQKGIIHRDLKPSNVLVAEGDAGPIPKVIDFGIAKAMETEGGLNGDMTRRSVVLGTPDFMAPEQTGEDGPDVDTRADVYSLGVLLYELLTGARPLELRGRAKGGYVELVRAIREEQPPKPSTRLGSLGAESTTIAERRRCAPRELGSQLRGDLDWIVMKALEKDRERRYESATAMAQDLARWLAHEPVLARPASRLYLARKFVRRHRGRVVAGSLILTSLVVGLVLATLGLLEAREKGELAQERLEVAEEQRRRSQSVVDLVSLMLGKAAPHESRGRDYTVRELLDEFSAGLGSSLDDAPGVAATIHNLIGNAYRGLGELDAAGKHLERGFALRREQLEPGHPELLASLKSLGGWYHDLGEYDRAEALYREGLASCRADDDGPRHLTAGFLASLSHLAWHRSEFEEAQVLLLEAVQINAGLGEAYAHQYASSLDSLAGVLNTLGDFEGAEREARRALQVERESHGGAESGGRVSRMNLSSALLGQGEFAAAEDVCRESLVARRRLYGEQHPAVASDLAILADVLAKRGELEQAEAISREVLEFWIEERDPQHTEVLRARNNLALRLAALGRHGEAVALLRRVLEDEPPGAPSGVDAARRRVNLAQSLSKQGDWEEAEGLAREALELSRGHFDGDHDDIATCLLALGNACRLGGRLEEATAHFDEALEVLRRMHGESHPRLVVALSDAAVATFEGGDVAGAEQQLRASHALGLEHFGSGHPRVVTASRSLVILLRGSGRAPEAVPFLREVIAAERAQRPVGDVALTPLLGALAEALLEDGAFAEAEPVLRECLDVLETRAPESWPRYHSMSLLGSALLGQGHLDEAEELLLEGEDHLRNMPAPVANRRRAVEALVELYERRGQPEEAEYWRSRLE